MFMEE
jgi:hypothetical protein